MSESGSTVSEEALTVSGESMNSGDAATMKKSNCILFALRRWFTQGGFIILRKSNYGWWPHMIWTKDLTTFEEFTPGAHDPNLVFPPLLFRGHVKRTNRKNQVAKGLKGQIIRAVVVLKKLKVEMESTGIGRRINEARIVLKELKSRTPTTTPALTMKRLLPEPIREKEETLADQLNRLEMKVAENTFRLDIHSAGLVTDDLSEAANPEAELTMDNLNGFYCRVKVSALEPAKY